MSWSPTQYLQFEEDRTRPVRDLLAAVPNTTAGSVADLGCGPGNSTELLARRFPDARVSGVDSSADMLDAARKRMPGTTFALADIAAWAPEEPQDVILANAVLQWLPDHPTLLPRLLRVLAPGGSLAIQVPDNMDEPSQALMRTIAADGPWAAALTAVAGLRTPLATPADYYAMLKPFASRVDIWATTYMHVLPGGLDGVVEWFKGSGLRPFLAPLPPIQREAFLDRYRAAIARAYPTLPDGSAILPFPRLFIVATVAVSRS